jgi:methyltransferase-like protein
MKLKNEIMYFATFGKFIIEYADDRPNEEISKQLVLEHWKNKTAEVPHHVWRMAI